MRSHVCSDMVALNDTAVFQCEFWTFSEGLTTVLWFTYCLLILFVTVSDILLLCFSFDNVGKTCIKKIQELIK